VVFYCGINYLYFTRALSTATAIIFHFWDPHPLSYYCCLNGVFGRAVFEYGINLLNSIGQPFEHQHIL
jgi:hypothetical protein